MTFDLVVKVNSKVKVRHVHTRTLLSTNPMILQKMPIFVFCDLRLVLPVTLTFMKGT